MVSDFLWAVWDTSRSGDRFVEGTIKVAAFLICGYILFRVVKMLAATGREDRIFSPFGGLVALTVCSFISFGYPVAGVLVAAVGGFLMVRRAGSFGVGVGRR